MQNRFADAVPPGPWTDPPGEAVVLPIRSAFVHQVTGFVVVGVSARLPPINIDGQRTQGSTATRCEAFIAEAARWIASQPNPKWEQDVDPVGFRHAVAHRPRVLVVDDNSDMRGYLRRLLSPYYEIETAESGGVALVAARACRPELILTDVMMPGLDGFGLVARLRADTALRDLPIILLPARAGEEARVEGLAAGADDYLTKPFSAWELLSRSSPRF